MLNHLDKGPIETVLVHVSEIPKYQAQGWKLTLRKNRKVHVNLGTTLTGFNWGSMYMWRAV